MQILIFILVFKSEQNNPTGFFDRKEMHISEAKNLNEDLNDLIWIPNIF